MTCKTFWNEVPKPIQIMVYTVFGIIAAVGFGLLFGWVIVWLWNWLMPMIFGLPIITFWQGVGIFILAKILFGGFSSSSSSTKKSKKDKCTDDWSKEWDSEKIKHKMERWEHYDEWWKSEGKASFEQYADNADGDGDAPVETQEDEEPKQE